MRSRSSRPRNKQAGFTLIETMTAVALVGGLAAVAIPTFADKPKKAKEAEASLELERMAKQAKSVFLADGAFPQGTATTLPGNDGAACKNPSKKFAPTTAWSNDIVWGTLDFRITEATKYSFHYESIDENNAIITAVADLNCDGTLTKLTMKLTGIDGDIQTAIDETSAQIADQVAVNDAAAKTAEEAAAAEAAAKHGAEEAKDDTDGTPSNPTGDTPYVDAPYVAAPYVPAPYVPAPYVAPTSTTTRNADGT
jgi:prepilin-type N-terminal cleavage/methylation domain-containing protein